MAYTKHQLEMIRLANRIADQRGASRRVRMSLLEAMAVESGYRNLNYGDRDSQGVLQQRPSQGWGAPGNPSQDINQYLDRAIRADKQGFKGTPGQLAQAVQRSAYPGRYDQRAKEAMRLLGMKGSGGGGPAAAVLSGGGGSPAVSGLTDDSFKHALVSQLMASSAAMAQGRAPDSSGLLSLAVMRRQLGSAGGGAPAPAGMGRSVEGGGGGPAGGAAAMMAAIRKAKQMGLHVSENPAVDHVDPVHTKNSYHYRTFKGSNVGEALDVSGDPKKMRAFALWLRSNRAKEAELFYDPLGGWKHGKPIGAIGGHGDHVHVAY